MTKAELIIKLTGDQAALTSLRSLESAMKNLHNSKAELRIDKAVLDREIAAARRAIDDFKKGANKPIILTVDGAAKAVASLEEARDVLRELTDEKRSVGLDVSEINIAEGVLRDARKELQEAEFSARDFINTLGDAFEMLAGINSATASFATGIGNSFRQMSGLFGSDILKTAGETVIRTGTQALIGDFGKIISRYDILNTFTQYMDAAGVASDQSADALQRVNDAILGLPIGLDEAADRLRRYQMFLGDVNDATNLTIGLQNAVMAGGAGAYSKTQAYQQVERLLVAGKLNTARQWVSLFQGLGVSLQYVAEEMGVSGMSARQLADGLMTGKIPAQDLLRALMRLGEGTSDTARKLDGLLDIYRGTLESWISNIQFAAVRGGETILKSLNEALLDATDTGIVGYLKTLRDAMNDFYKSAGGFITGNPQLLKSNIDSVQRLFDAFGRFSASDIGTMVFENLSRAVDMLTQALNKLPTEETEEFIAFAVTLAGPISKLFEIVAAGAPVMIAVFERFKDFDFEHLLDRIVEEVDRLAGIIERLLNLLDDDALTELITYGLVYGAPAARGFSAIADAMHGLADALIIITSLKVAFTVLTYGFGTILSIGGKLAAFFSNFGIALVLFREALFAITPVISGLVATLAPSAAIIAGLAKLDDIRVDKSREYTTADIRGMSDADLRRIYADRKAKIEALEGSDALEPVLVGEETAEEANIALRSYRRELSDVETVMKEMGVTVEDTTGAVDAFAEAAENAAAAAEHAADAGQTLGSRLAETRNAIAIAQEEMSSLWAKQVDLFTEMEAVAKVSFKDLEKALASNAQAFIDYQENAEKAARFVADHPELGDAAANLFASVAAGGLENAGLLAALVDKFEDDYDQFIEYVKNYALTHEGQLDAQDWAAILASGLSSDDLALYLSDEFGLAMSHALERMPELVAKQLGTDALRDEMFALRNGGTPEGVDVESLRQKLDPVIESYKETAVSSIKNADFSDVSKATQEKTEEIITDAMGNAGFEEATAELTGALGEVVTEAAENADVDAAANALVQRLAESISNADAAQIYDALSGLLGRGAGDGMLLSSMLPMSMSDDLSFVSGGTSIPELLRSFEGLSTAMQAFTNFGQPQMSESIELLQNSFLFLMEEGVQPFTDAGEWIWEVTVPGVVESLIELIDTIEDLIDVFEELIDTMDDAGRSADALRTAVINLANTMSQKQSTLQEFTSTVDGVRDSAYLAVAAVNELAAAISSLSSKQVTVGVDTGGRAISRAAGGVVQYRAAGGSLFTPRGTDTVPAMLTPGEFVMRRGAVQALGLDFMKRINGLDIGAAVQSLYRRIPQVASFMPVYSSVNNHNDNRNVSVNQNIYTNNPDYTYRMASRWAHAL